MKTLRVTVKIGDGVLHTIETTVTGTDSQMLQIFAQLGKDIGYALQQAKLDAPLQPLLGEQK